MAKHLPQKPNTQLLIYQTESGDTKIEVRLEDETVWLTQKLMAELFQITIPTINEHIKNIYNEAELGSEATIRKFRIVQKEGNRSVKRTQKFYKAKDFNPPFLNLSLSEEGAIVKNAEYRPVGCR